jgi:large subunit ribosomal protein L15
MVVHRKETHRKYRGKRAQGYGSHKKHRGGGSRGGRGRAGLHKHKWSYVVKYEPDAFGKKGFKRPIEIVEKVRTINLKDLDTQVDRFLKEKIAEKEGEQIKITLSKIGFDKVLGSGKVTKPLIVEAKYFSKNAIKKLEEAGGKAIKVG